MYLSCHNVKSIRVANYDPDNSRALTLAFKGDPKAASQTHLQVTLFDLPVQTVTALLALFGDEATRREADAPCDVEPDPKADWLDAEVAF